MGYYVTITCPDCGGAKFVHDGWHEETGKELMKCCDRCSGLGEISVWTDEDYYGF